MVDEKDKLERNVMSK